MADLTDEEIAELRRLALLEADEPSSAASDVLLAPNGQKIVARLIVDGRLLPMLDEVERRRERDARTLALLQRIEFASVQSGDLVCPECECIEATGHGSDCALAKLIADLQRLGEQFLQRRRRENVVGESACCGSFSPDRR